MFKRLLRTSLSLLLITSFLIASASASITAETLSPRYSHITSCMAGLSIQNSVANAEGAVSARLLASRICVRLQRKDPEGWVNIAVWYGSADVGLSSAGGTFTLTKTGYDYRTQVIATVYSSSGELLESEIMYSDIKSY